MKMFGIAAVVFKIFSEIQDKIVNGARVRAHIVIPNSLQIFSLFTTSFCFRSAASGAWFLFYSTETFILLLNASCAWKSITFFRKHILRVRYYGPAVFIFLNQLCTRRSNSSRLKGLLIIISTLFQTEHPVCTGIMGAEYQNGYRFCLTRMVSRTDTVNARQHNIQDHQVEIFIADGLVGIIPRYKLK
jgi:hypothetical protein